MYEILILIASFSVIASIAAIIKDQKRKKKTKKMIEKFENVHPLD